MSEVPISNSTRLVVLDDQDPRIHYSPPSAWFLDTRPLDNLYNRGATYNYTQHGTNTTGASFSLDFEGDFIFLLGTRIGNFTADQLSWSCAVDGVGIVTKLFHPQDVEATRYVLCEQGSLPRKLHTLTVNITVKDPSSSFYLDYIQYSPLEEMTSGTILVDSSDRSISYTNQTGEWSAGPDTIGTFKPGATFSLNFNGTSASLWTEILTGSGPSTGSYYVDNSNPIPFTIPGAKTLSNGSAFDFFDQLLFTTSELEPGSHDLVVTYTGQGTPPQQGLGVSYFTVNVSAAGGTSTGGTGSSGGTGTDGSPNSNTNTTGANKKSSKSGVIAGATVGAVALFTILGLAVFFFLKRRRQKRRDSVQPFRSDVPPEERTHTYTSIPVSPSQVSQSALDNGSGARLDQSPGDASSSNWSSMKEEQRRAVARTSNIAGGSNIRRHQDSGVRIGRGEEDATIDLPPNYTED